MSPKRSRRCGERHRRKDKEYFLKQKKSRVSVPGFCLAAENSSLATLLSGLLFCYQLGRFRIAFCEEFVEFSLERFLGTSPVDCRILFCRHVPVSCVAPVFRRFCLRSIVFFPFFNILTLTHDISPFRCNLERLLHETFFCQIKNPGAPCVHPDHVPFFPRKLSQKAFPASRSTSTFFFLCRRGSCSELSSSEELLSCSRSGFGGGGASGLYLPT